jgi:hypothetical protein
MGKLNWNRVIFYFLGAFTGGIVLGFFGGLTGKKG